MIKPYTDYSPFEAQDFLDDPPFRAWVARPTPEMTAYWQGLLRTHPHLRGPFEQASVLAQGLAASWTPFSDVYTQQLFDRIRPALIITPPQPLKTTVPWIRRARVWRYGAVAAGLLLVTGLWVKTYFFTAHTYQTRFAQTRTLPLYDGSTATLNANSRLLVPSRYAWRQARTVILTGEAYFSVHKQPARTGTGYRTFTVQTNQISVEVLGTQFNVYARPQRTAVRLDEGRVRLVERSTNRPVLIRPGQEVVLTDYSKKAKVTAPTPERARQQTAWLDNLLIFNDADMTELTNRFREVYGLELVLRGEAFAGQQFRGELPVNNVGEALQILSATFGRKAIRDENRVYFVNDQAP